MNTIGTKGFVEIIDHMGSDLTVVNAARVSFNKMSKWQEEIVADKDGMIDISYSLEEKDKKLINYLVKHNHWTPFAHCYVTLHIKAPIPIRTQFFKHKIGFVENEISRRYVDEPPEFFYPSWSGRPKNKKQGAGEELDTDTQNKAYLVYAQQMDFAKNAYEDLLKLGVAPEQARFVLPQSTYTEWYWTGSLAAYARFYKQRSDPHAQSEIRDYADVIGEILSMYFPVSWQALTNSESTPE
jgi:thymidylate synthase (FAD)